MNQPVTPSIMPFDTRDAWLAARRQFIGASEAAAVCGLDPYMSAYALWAEKSGRIVDEHGSDGDISEAAYWGNTLEPLIANRYAEETGLALKDYGRTTLMRGDHPHVVATLDREILAPGAHGVLEIKAPGFLQRDNWVDGPPERHVIQLQAQLAVTGLSWGAIAALIGGQDFRIYRVDRDQELIDLVLERVDEFMKCVREDMPPKPDGSEATARVLKRLFPEDSGVTVELNESEHWRWAVQLRDCREEARAIQKRIDEAENHLRLAIGDATFANVKGSLHLSAKTTKRAGYSVEPTTFRALKFIDTTKAKGRK